MNFNQNIQNDLVRQEPNQNDIFRKSIQQKRTLASLFHQILFNLVFAFFLLNILSSCPKALGQAKPRPLTQQTSPAQQTYPFRPNHPFQQGAQVSDQNSQPVEPDIGYLNIPTKTMGGKQFWTDFRNVDGWRIQQNSVTNHFRLIDSNNIRRAWGNRVHCNGQLNQRIRKGIVRRLQGKVVILLHGLVRTSSSMAPMARHLRSQGFSPILFSYASSRKSIGEHAKALNQVIQGLGPAVTEIHFVGHSMGNIVVRRYLKDQTNPKTQIQGDPRIKSVVMIGPPNQGSKMATLFSGSLLFQSIAGVGGIELGAGWKRDKDAQALQIMNDLIIPQFKAGDFSAGIKAGVEGLDKMARDLQLPSKPRPASHYWIGAIFFGLLIFTVVSLIRRGSSGWAWLFWGVVFSIIGAILYQMMSNSSSGGGGFSGGSFGGGFSGGGGATGSW